MSIEALELAQKIAHEVWGKDDDTYGYRTEKQTYNDQPRLTQDPDNIWFFWGQFDHENHNEFYDRVNKTSSNTPGREELQKWCTEEWLKEQVILSELADKGIQL